MKQKHLLIVFFSCLFFTTQAQNKKPFGKVPITRSIKGNAKSFKATSMFSKLKVKSGTDFRKTKSRKDKLGMDHTTYQQYHKGIKVEYGKLKVHAKTGGDSSYNGEFYDVSEVNTSPRLSERAAFERTKRRIQADTYAWEEVNNPLVGERPKGELVIFPNVETEKIHLAYKLDIFVIKPKLVRGFAYIDAHTGEFLFFNPKLRHTKHATKDVHPKPKGWVKPEKKSNILAAAPGTADTRFSESQGFNTYNNSGTYVLMDDTKTNGNPLLLGGLVRRGIITMNVNNATSIGGAVDFTDTDNNWTSAEYDNTAMDNAALDVHWGMDVVYDYWNDTHGWKSYDNNDSFLLSFMHYGDSYINAGWTGSYMIYGDGGTQGSADIEPLVSLDITAHEVAHGINDNTADLVYQRESGAMDEGFADIWAMVIDNYANTNRGTSKDINLIGEEVVNYYNGWPALRSMSNPNQMQQPDTYMGTYWEDASASCTPDLEGNDYCGVHTNSGVLNHWFYLLSTGGTGTNDIGSTFTVSAIGIDNAASITFRMQSVYLSANSGFAEARDASIQAAIDLFGGCSTQVEATTNAFYAVGVGAAYVAPVNAVVTVAPTDVAQCVGTEVTFSITATDAATYEWQENDGSTWNTITNNDTYDGVATAALTITNISYELNDYQYRCVVANTCEIEVTSSAATLTAVEFPVATAVVTASACGGDTGIITVTFSDDPNQGFIEFSIDNGATYPYVYKDTSEEFEISNLATGDYPIRVRWKDDSCPLDLGTVTMQAITPPNATVTTVDAAVGVNDGILQLTFTDDAAQTTIEFSVDNGVTYPYSYDDASEGVEISGLAAGDYPVWVRWDDASCVTDLGTFTISEIVYTSIPDANFEVALDALGYDNYAGDARVPTNLISGVTTLDVGAQSISSLSGIEDFVALTVLKAYNNPFGSIDVSNLSQLVSLWIHSGGSLAGLDVTTNILLEDLRVENNQLEEIDLTNNPLLRILQINNNALEVLDVTNNTALTRIRAQNNPITELDLSNNTALTEINASSGLLTVLNVKNGNNDIITSFKATGNSSLTCIQVDDPAGSTLDWEDIDDQTSFNTDCSSISVSPKVFLQGAMLNPNTGEENWMRDDLRVAGLVSMASPYNPDGINASVLAITGANAIVDWVLVEFRDPTDNSIVVTSRGALIQRDGDIVTTDGVSPLSLSINAGYYYMVINHRNHLNVITAEVVNLSSTTTTVDFTADSTTVLGGTNALIEMSTGIFAMLGGDYDDNGQVQNSDTSAVTIELGSSGYSNADMDMNGQVQNTDINNLMSPNIGKGQQF